MGLLAHRFTMAGLRLSLALAISCILLVSGDDDHGKIAQSYNAEEFDQEITKIPHFIMFFAPWCGHCKKLAPAWDQLAGHYAKSDKVTVAKVDCTVEKDLCQGQGVSGYPTVKFFDKDASAGEKYKGGRDFDTLKAFVENKIGGAEAPKKVEAADISGLVELKPTTWDSVLKTDSVFIKFYAPWCGHCKRLAPAWDDLAQHYKDDKSIAIAKIDCTDADNKPICDKFEVRGYPTLLFFKGGEMQKKYQGSRELPELTKFADKMRGGKEAAPKEEKKAEEKKPDAVVDLNAESFELFTSTGSHFIKFYAPWCGHCKRLAPAWSDLAKEFENNKDVSIDKIDCTAEDSKSVCSKFEVRGYPTLLFFKDGQMVEKYSGGRDLSALKSYVLKKSGSSAEEEEKKTSEDGKIPTKSTEPTVENGVHVYNAENFATGISKGVTFVKFYAPWCGHCKRLAPTWDDLAKAYEGSSKVKIAKLDCTTDREVCTQYGVRGFPTLKLFKDGEIFHDYSGARDQKALEKFIESKTSEAHDEL